MRTWRYIKLKAKRRLKPVLAHLVAGFLPPLLNILISWAVISMAGEAVWGGFVDWRIIVSLSVAFMAYGNTDFLLRAFARVPAERVTQWRRVFASRSVLLFIALPAILLSPVSMNAGAFLLLWMVAGFVSQSFQVAILYSRRFGLSILSDAVAFLGPLGALFFYEDGITSEILLQYATLGSVAKALILAGGFARPYLTERGDSAVNFRYFYLAMPFFIHGFMGLLQSRADLVCVSWILKDDAATGRYQVFISMFVHLQSIAGFILLPFVRNLYRLASKNIWKISFKLFWIGVGLTVLAVPVIRWVILHGYELEFPIRYYAWGALLVIPVYFYAPLIYMLYKHEAQQSVILANVGGVLFNIALNISLIHTFELEGALIASTAAQWFTLGLTVYFSMGFIKENPETEDA